MDKFAFLLLAFQQGKYREKQWMNRAFALVQETKTLENSSHLDIVQSTAGFFYKDQDKKELVQITGSIVAGQPLYSKDELISLKKGDLPGIMADVETKIGRITYHMIVHAYAFGDGVPFDDGTANMSSFEDLLADKLRDQPEEGTAKDPNYFYPDELNKYYEGVVYLRSLDTLFVPAASKKTLTIDKAVLARRDELFNDPKIDMNDQATAARVEAELTAMDKESFKDDPASGFLIDKKDFRIIRKKRFISFGSGGGLTPDTTTRYVKASLNEGMDVNHFVDYNNESRAGSYKRGVETMFGGELDKWLVRESSNIRVVMEDCGSKVGVPDVITHHNKLSMLGKHIIEQGKLVQISEDNIGSYLGKSIFRRSPATCKQEAPDYCTICLGPKLSINPDAISIAFSQYGHDFMGESMSAMHGKELTTSLMDLVFEAS